MKKAFLGIVLFFFVLMSCFSQSQEQEQEPETKAELPASVQRQTDRLKYIPVRNFSGINSISLSNINDLSTLISDYKINHVFFTENMFLVQAPSIMVPFSIPSNGFKNIADCQRGSAYTNGAAYYYAVENKLNSQEEVDYFRQERFLTSDDYRQAQKDDFVKTGAGNRMSRISGIIKKSDLEKNIYFANAIIYYLYYQQTDLVRSFLDNKDVVALTLPFAGNRNTSYRSSNIIVEFKTGYFYINLDISSLDVNKDAIFYYASKFAQYLNYADYQRFYSNANPYTIKNSETIAKNELEYASYQECLNDINSLLGRTR